MSQLSLDLSPELDYQLVVSRRARRLSLRVEPGRGVIVTVPQRFARREVPAFVEKNRAWIESALADVEQRTPERFRQWPPQRLGLPAIGQVLELSYHAVGQSLEGVSEIPDPGACAAYKAVAVSISADPASKAAVATELSFLLKSLAREHLPDRLQSLASGHRLNYRRVQIRGQRTLWGSCSSSGTISLNYKLLFLSPVLLDYVLLHELAHTRHMDHSPAFWRQLIAMSPDARALDAQLSQAGQEVPAWLELAS